MLPVIHNKAELAVPKQLSVPRVGIHLDASLSRCTATQVVHAKASFELIEHVAASASRQVCLCRRASRLRVVASLISGCTAEVVRRNLSLAIWFKVSAICVHAFSIRPCFASNQNGVDIFGAPFFHFLQ